MDKRIPGDKQNTGEWQTLTAIAAVAWLVIGTGCTPEHGGPEAGGAGEAASSTAMPAMGKGGDDADPAVDDVVYLTQLGLIRGHLHVGYSLYDSDLPDLAATHMKHPREEIYRHLQPAFGARGCGGFADGLMALTTAVVDRAEKSAVADTYENLMADIRACEEKAMLSDPNIAVRVVQKLLRTASHEYLIGVIDGEIDNLHEYQDAWGFVQIAKDYAGLPALAGSAEAIAAAGRIQDLLDSLDGLWPSLAPEGGIDGNPRQRLRAAENDMEITVLGLQNE